ncbi:MAG: alpha/beta fold hydrolase, partial [Cellulosilyticum sp.]|nr:alpha/beta fold hydrolase [Cellulosilyticum sp.]
MENYESKVLLNNGINLSYIKKGQGKKVLILHGNRDSKQNFIELIDDLAKDYMVFAVDLRGHGKSDKPKLGYQFEKFVE